MQCIRGVLEWRSVIHRLPLWLGIVVFVCAGCDKKFSEDEGALPTGVKATYDGTFLTISVDPGTVGGVKLSNGDEKAINGLGCARFRVAWNAVSYGTVSVYHNGRWKHKRVKTSSFK